MQVGYVSFEDTSTHVRDPSTSNALKCMFTWTEA